MAQLREEGANIRPSLIFSGRWDHVHVRYSTAQRRPPRPRPRTRSPTRRASIRSRCLIDIAIGDDFETQFAIAMRSPDDDRLGELVAHPAAQLGGSDAGAHTQSNTDSCYAVWTLQHWVRERGVLTLRAAVAMLTSRQAELFGIRDRGRIAAGAFADLVLFDPARIGIDDVHFVADMPAGGTRLVAEPVGITASVVNGVVVMRDGELTGALPGPCCAAAERQNRSSEPSSQANTMTTMLTARHNVIGSKRMRRATTSAAMSRRVRFVSRARCSISVTASSTVQSA